MTTPSRPKSLALLTGPATLDHTFIMLRSVFGRCMGISAVVCVLLMFLFPLPYGNFQSTHGPVTALRCMRALLLLIFSIVSAALQILAPPAPVAFSKPGRFCNGPGQCWSFDFDQRGTSLRC